MRFQFGSIVVVDGGLIGVVCKMWDDGMVEVYVREHNSICLYQERNIDPYVFSKELVEEDFDSHPNARRNRG